MSKLALVDNGVTSTFFTTVTVTLTSSWMTLSRMVGIRKIDGNLKRRRRADRDVLDRRRIFRSAGGDRIGRRGSGSRVAGIGTVRPKRLIDERLHLGRNLGQLDDRKLAIGAEGGDLPGPIDGRNRIRVGQVGLGVQEIGANAAVLFPQNLEPDRESTVERCCWDRKPERQSRFRPGTRCRECPWSRPAYRLSCRRAWRSGRRRR